MTYMTARRPLFVHTVESGLYRGFSPAVSVSAQCVTLLLVAVLLALPGASGAVLAEATAFSLRYFAGWYSYLMAGFVAVLLILVCLPVSGRVRLGPDGSRPDISTTGWLSMMFCSGIGTGILVFSVSEPLSHFVTNPDLLNGTVAPGSDGAVASSMRFVFLHWGVSAWAGYAVAGLALGLACHRRGHPMTIRSAIAPLFGKRLEGVLGHLIDILSILAIIAGLTTTIVLGLEQVCTGLAALTGRPLFARTVGDAQTTALLIALVVAIALSVASITSGLDRGVKWTSQFGILLAIGVMIVFAVFGAGFRVFGVFAESGWAYVTSLPRQLLTLYPSDGAGAELRAWQEDWSIFYWAWWIAFAPFVGLFLARVSRGRTVREFILGAVLGPTLMCFAWFSATGGSALLLELDGTAQGRLIATDHGFRIYAAVDMMMPAVAATVIKALLVLLFMTLIVATSTAAIIAIKSIGAAGSNGSDSLLHATLWSLLVAAIAGAIIAIGGVGSVRSVMIVGALPFSIIMALMIPAVLLMIASTPLAAPVHPGLARRLGA